MSFVKLENLNDFIQPSSSCIKPFEKKQGVVAKVNDVSLSDCLACSGCITSAESVLVQQQNYEELFSVINRNKTSQPKKEILVTLSLQSIISLAHKYSLGVQEAAERLSAFLISLGCDRVYDINLARHLALVESYREFKQSKAQKPNLPVISSICPGWICYAEKVNGDLIIPHLSKVRSPQQIMGALLKEILSRQCGVTTSKADLYHVTVMPCFDKKLEASRNDFKDELNASQDVDCVLTPIELEEILRSEGVTLAQFERRPLDILIKTGTSLDMPLTSNFGSVSGGYAENILLASAGNNCDIQMDDLEYSMQKNSDFIEVGLKRPNSSNNINESRKLPRIAIVNGFRNIQTVVQRLKRKALKYDYIEIMACPSGCINGGAQCKPNSGEDQSTCSKLNKDSYESVPGSKLSVDYEASTNDDLYAILSLNDEMTRLRLLYTEFHPVPKMQNLTVSW